MRNFARGSSAVWLLAAVPAACGGASATAATQDYDLPAQSLGASIRAVALQSGRNVISSSALISGKRAPPLKGHFEVGAAIDALLVGSGLRARVLGDGLVIERGVESTPGGRSTSPNDDSEILVTGTRIRGAAPSGASVITIDRAQIERSGYTTTQQVLQAIPQNFGGGPNEATLGAGVRNGAGSNSAYGSSANLRGLGTSSTLVLFNGNRPALGGLSGVFADLSLVPPSAIERIEVLADGASALYGSDAVAGVVNIRFRDHFDGAETRLRYGFADGFDEVQASQIVGTHWASGHAVVAYEFYRRGSLAASDRAYATEDLRPFGGPDYRVAYANPGTIVAGGRNFAIPAGQNGVGLAAANLLPGVINRLDERQATDLLPRQRTHSIYASGSQELGDTMSLYAQALFADRAYEARYLPFSNTAATVPVTNPFYVDPLGTRQPVRVQYSFVNDLGAPTNHGSVEGYSGVLGLVKTLGSWSVDLHGAYGRQREDAYTDNIANTARLTLALADLNPATAYNVFGDGSVTNPATINQVRGSFFVRNRYRVASAATKADGALFSLPAGEVKLAVGGEYRSERYLYRSLSDTRTLTPTPGSLAGLPGPRHVGAEYAELLVPLIAPAMDVPGVRSLDLSVAGRHEHYSDVGSTTNPKVGATWVPFSGLSVRGSYGRSFRAPAFTDLVGTANALYQPFIATDPASPTGTRAVLAVLGNAPGLGPEKATTWTAGADLQPLSLPGARLAITYFDIDYRDRIGTANPDIFNYLSNRAVYGGLITDSPSAATVAAYYAATGFSNPSNIPAAQITALLDGTTRNLSLVHETGLDLDASYRLPAASGEFTLGVTGTYLFHVDQKLTAGAPTIDVAGTLGNPNTLRLRGSALWSSGGLDVSTFLNFVDGYENRIVTPAEHVTSWTAVDAQVAYTLPKNGPLGALRLSLSVSNLLDREPPYANNRSVSSALGYDPDQASPTGRLVAFQITKGW